MTAQAVLAFLEKHKSGSILLTSHQRPDGDAIGSAFGLADVLRAQGYRAMVAEPTPTPPGLRFLVDETLVAKRTGNDWWRGFTCLGLLDCGAIDRLEDADRAAAALPAFNIDHHISSRGVGQAVWIDGEASSTGEMIVRFCREAGWPLTPRAAEALWTAIVTDTGRFSFENTTPAALDAARHCLLAGADPSRVARSVYQAIGLPERRLQALVLERMELSEGGKLATSWLAEADFQKAGIDGKGDYDLIDLLRDTAGVEVSALFYELSGAEGARPVKTSLRTVSPYNAVTIVEPFGGGGHMRAAGCTLSLPLAEAREAVLAKIREVFFGKKLR